MMRSYSNDELIKFMDAAPLPVQQAIESKATAKVISTLGNKLGLHVDVIGKIAELTGKMLLGLVNSQDSLQELINAGVSEKDTRDIITEINQKIFVPLHQQVREGMQKMEQPKPAVPRAPILPPRTTVIPANPQMPTRPPETFVSVPKYAPPQKYFKLQNKIPPPVQPPPKPLDNSRLLEDHEEPHIELHSMPPPGPRTAPPPPNLTGAPRPSEASGGEGMPSQRPVPPLPPTPPSPEATEGTARPPAERYSTDPYREPIE